MQHHLYILDHCILYDHTAKTPKTPCQQGTTKRKKKRRREEEDDGEMDLLHCIVAVVKEAPNGEVIPQLHQQLQPHECLYHTDQRPLRLPLASLSHRRSFVFFSLLLPRLALLSLLLPSFLASAALKSFLSLPTPKTLILRIHQACVRAEFRSPSVVLSPFCIDLQSTSPMLAGRNYGLFLCENFFFFVVVVHLGFCF